ncbi:hypothetical protein JOD43_001569 [Pullulanibacillus pueri]|uniref:DUF3231 family protein n=1 Tax=Pullulanibacillus pueri TaxID=1437324 RepID=A0A8J2ZVA1_9BACL|nr:DUF3231 family protein [Pullulanibacillus pueri]MBM7681402.1 hypothetical protein [Pullulanibacillus pueri]GGH78738.1 hypothetical protein GCM10007096_12620 [Pullulanibacillus pueri]
MPKKMRMNAAELGALWMTYHKKTMILRILEYFIETSDQPKAKSLMAGLWEKLDKKVTQIKKIIENDGATVPSGFAKDDVNLKAPKLFDHGFDIMFCRILKEISMGMYVLHLTIAYRQDIIELYRDLTELTQTYYQLFTEYLLKEDLLARPPFTIMPHSTDTINDPHYLKGTNLFGDKRQLNTVEFGYLYHGIETNITGMQLMTGFAQCCKDEKVKDYFMKGMELSKHILKGTTNLLLQDNIQVPVTPGGTVTNSTESPFSERLMMFCTYLLCGFSLGSQSFGAAFNLRNDLILKQGLFGKDVYEFAREGIKIMVSKGWYPEPPKMDL